MVDFAGMQTFGRILYWVFTGVALALAGLAVFEFVDAEWAKGNAMMRAGLYFLGAVLVWSFGRGVLRALAGR